MIQVRAGAVGQFDTMTKLHKQRLDVVVFERGLASSRARAQALIMAGRILVNEQPVDKPGTRVTPDDRIRCTGDELPYVSRGGIKLAAALDQFQVAVEGRTCLDVGASTGGFTDCLLQCGARQVYSVDVGYGQMAWKLRQDPRVVVMERTNIRHMPRKALPQTVDLITIDVSFISLRIVVPACLKFLKPDGRILALVKPQFEVGKGQVGKGGVVRDAALRDAVLKDLQIFLADLRLHITDPIPSPILGPKGNQEYLLLCTPQA